MNAGWPWRNLRQLGGTSLLVLLAPSFALGADWPQYRGPNHDGISTDRINTQWSGSVTNPMWLIPLTNCLGSVTVSGGRAFTQTVRNIGGVAKELCLALNATNGAPLWTNTVDDARYPEGGVGFDDGPRSTPVVEEGSVYVLSSYLKLYRFNATNGTLIWQKDLRAIYGGNVIGWQNAASPVLENGLIFVNANCGTMTLLALRTSDGAPAWRSQDEAMTHATPVVTTLHGVRQVLFATQSGVVSLVPDSGDLLWRFNYPFSYSTSLGASPVVYDDMVFVCGAQAYGMGSVVWRVDFANNTWTTTQLWAITGFSGTLSSHWMTPVARQGFLYGQFGVQSFDSVNAQLKCVDMRTGAIKWSTNGFGRGSTILVGDNLLTLAERGQLVLIQPNTNAYAEIARFTAIPNYNGNTNKCWNTPAICDGRVYVRSTAYAACFDLSVPDLKLDVPEPGAPGELRLTVRTVNGTPISSNRLAGLEVRGATRLSQPVVQWDKLTNSLTLTDGVVRIDSVAAGGQHYFIASEPK
jgi:outer membrane protein assembly factor BamB